MKIVRIPVLFLAALALAQEKPTLQFDSDQGKIVVSYNSFVIKKISESKSSIQLKGNPVRAEWKMLNMTAQAKVFDALAERTKSSGFELKSATLQDSVKLDLTDEQGKLKGSCELAKFVATAPRSGNLSMDRNVQVVRTLPTGVTQMACQSADFEISKGELASGNLSGGVNLISTRTDANGQKHQFAAKAAKAVLIGRRLIKLSGGVTIKGDEPQLIGDLAAETVTITMNEQGQPIQIEGSGGPGTGSLTQKGGG